MPTVEPSADTKVLVSGANGYIAMWVIRTLLEQGYTVRGAVRSVDKGKRLREFFHSYGDKVEWVVVEDITKDGAFDEAVEGVGAIVHTASPLVLMTSDPDAYIKPAVHGTVGILKSALKFGNQVKRIVVTSSVAAISSTVKVPTETFDETHWADEPVRVVKEQGIQATAMMKYRASKTLAEKAAWEFHKEHKAEIQWDLVTLHPPFVLGPSLQDPKTPADLNASMAMFYDNVVTEKSDDVLQGTASFIHVGDIAAAHVAALTKDAAGGERIIIAEDSSTWQDIRNLILSLRPELYSSGALPRGNPNLPNIVQFKFNNEKGKKIFGLKYKPLKEIFMETLVDFEERGWIAKKD